MRGWSRIGRALLALGLAMCGATGCLPAGGPPTGQRWLAGRTLTLYEFAPTGGGASLSLLVGNQTSNGEADDMYLVADPGRTAASSAAPTVTRGATLLLPNAFGPSTTLPYLELAPPLPQDAAGRLLVAQSDPGSGYASTELFRIDLTTGTALDLGPEVRFALSPSGQRFVLDVPDATTTVYEADGSQITLANASEATFVGENLYLLQADDPADVAMQTLEELTPDGALQTIAQGLTGFQALSGTTSGDLILSVADGDGTFSSSLLDPTTLAQTPLPGDYQSASPDGRCLLLSVFGDDSVSWNIFDASTGAITPAPSPSGGWGWRPGHDAFWAMEQNPSPQTYRPPMLPIQIWQPATGTTTIDVGDATLQAYQLAPSSNPTPFTPDGRYWFSARFSAAGSGQCFVGPADDPTAPTFPVNPVGTRPGQYWQLADERLLVEATVGDYTRNDIYLVDPVTGASRELASGGHVVMTGATRALTLLNWISSAATGDLTLIDFDTGATTVLAENVSQVVLQPPAETTGLSGDPLAPGLDVAFVVHDLLDSPYDGVWVATLP